MDEGRFGRISVLRSCWAPEPVRPKVPRQVVRESLYAFAAIDPRHGEGVASLSPKCNTPAMSRFLLEVLGHWPDLRLLLFLDGAGWHKSKQLPVPERLRLELLPPYTPECNPTEHVWDETREKGFANQFFADLAAVEVRLETQLALLLNDRERLRQLTCFPWIADPLLYL
jgi:transposase